MTAKENKQPPNRTGGSGSARFIPLSAMLVLCTLNYYFGELVDLAGWAGLHWGFFDSVHDVHRLLFLGPILYGSWFFGVRGAMIMSMVSFTVFLPRAIFFSPYPDPLLRMSVFCVFAAGLGYAAGRLRQPYLRSQSVAGPPEERGAPGSKGASSE